MDYQTFRQALASSGCRLCPLAAGRKTIVVDRGSPSARILLVGEGPGAEEDRQGLAFVGASGKLLDEMLIDADLDPARDILIANVVKCRPPGNRPPAREEALACLPFLKRQIELLRPRILVLLGATAVKHLLPRPEEAREVVPPRGSVRKRRSKGLAALLGRFLAISEHPDLEILVTYHPAYILRNRRKRPEMVRHLGLLTQRLADLVREGIPLN